jgi:putative membrane protein
MIVKEPLPWIRMLLSVKGSSLPRTLPRILAVTIISIVVTAAELLFDQKGYTLTATPFTVIGLALGIYLGFRNNAAYDRFWEGRKLWGQLVNSSRSFARQTLSLIRPHTSQGAVSAAEQQEVEACQQDLVRHAIAFVHALRHQLRDSDPFDDLSRFLPLEEIEELRWHRNVPFAVSMSMARRVRQAWDRGWISAYHLPVMEKTLAILTDIQGGCERIKNTPIPWAYTVLLHRLVAIYCLLLPFGIIDTTQWLTPVVVLLITHTFFGLDEIGDELEQPFGTEPQDLPLSAISRTIEVNLLQAIGEREIPDLLQPVDGVLN